MNKIATYLLILLFITACNSDEKTNLEISEEIKTINELADWELNEIEMQAVVDSKNKEFKKLMKEKDFVFQDDGCKQGMVGEEDMNTYSGKGAYNISTLASDTSLLVNFTFINSCCLDYIGDINWSNDTLKLKYSINSYTPCDCSCSYCSFFEIQTKEKNYSTITLNGKVIE